MKEEEFYDNISYDRLYMMRLRFRVPPAENFVWENGILQEITGGDRTPVEECVEKYSKIRRSYPQTNN